MGKGTREALLREAARQLADAGSDGLVLSRVAAAVGIRPASVFHHFPGGKAELEAEVDNIITATVASWLESVLNSDLVDNPHKAIMDMAAGFWDLFEAHPEIAALMLRRNVSWNYREAEEVDQQASAIIDASARFIRDAQDKGQLAPFDLQLLFIPTALICVSYHGAPGMRRLIEARMASDLDPRQAYLDAIEGVIGTAP
jgi:AcrR family transcriptional regulator